MKKKLRFVGKFGDLIKKYNYKSTYMYASNYKCYTKTVPGSDIWIWVAGRTMG